MRKIFMRTLLAVLLIALIAALVACGEPTPTPTPSPEPLMRGDSVVIFGATDAFTVVFDSTDSSGSGTLASEIITAVKELGLKAPAASADNGKTETKCELLVGSTNRALSAAAKAALDAEIAKDPYGDYWIWMYKDGQLALYSNSERGYSFALEELTDKYYVAGEITVKKDAKDIGYLEGPHLAYMEYEIPDNYYEGYTDPFSVKEKDYKQMTLTFVDSTTYRISYMDEDKGIFTADLVQKAWGVWNMGATSYRERNGTIHNMTSSSTDYEFVLRVNGKGNTGLKSGNHGNYPKDSAWEYTVDDTSYYNDRLLDITFYDGKTGEKIELAGVGRSATVNGLRIVMHHNVYEFNYTQENVLVNAERNYLYNGYDIMCDTKLYMTQDVKFAGSYSAMLPISKQYGNCAMFYREDGSTVYMKTPLSNTVNETVYGVNATHIDLWGEKNPRYHMIVKVNNPEDQYKSPEIGKNKGYAGFREMLGSGSNKLYIQFGGTKFNMKWGEELHFNTTWSFSIQNDFRNPDYAPDFWVGVPK